MQALRKLLLIPTRLQYDAWSLPSKIGFISLWMGVFGLLLTISIFVYQENSSSSQQSLSQSTAEQLSRIEKHLSRGNSTVEVGSTTTGQATNSECDNTNIACTYGKWIDESEAVEFLKPSRELLKTFGKATHRQGLGFIVLGSKVHIYSDPTKRNQRPMLAYSSVQEWGLMQYLARLELIDISQKIPPALLIVSVHGATGSHREIEFVAPISGKYQNIVLHNIGDYFIIEDIDADGIVDIVGIEVNTCNFMMSSLNLSRSPIAFRPIAISQTAIRGLLSKSLLGNELLTVWEIWSNSEPYCSRTSYVGGDIYSEMKRISDKARANTKGVVSALGLQVRQSDVLYIDPRVFIGLLR